MTNLPDKNKFTPHHKMRCEFIFANCKNGFPFCKHKENSTKPTYLQFAKYWMKKKQPVNVGF